MAEETTYQDISRVLSDIVNRIRSLESKYNTLAERLLVVNQNMISQFKKNSTEFTLINSEIKKVNSEIFKSREIIQDLSKEMQFFATKENIKVLEKYINLWDPMKFVTGTDLELALKKLKDESGNNRSKN